MLCYRKDTQNVRCVGGVRQNDVSNICTIKRNKKYIGRLDGVFSIVNKRVSMYMQAKYIKGYASWIHFFIIKLQITITLIQWTMLRIKMDIFYT